MLDVSEKSWVINFVNHSDLKGDPGTDGTNGVDGIDGTDGTDGVDGADGLTVSVNGVTQVDGDITLGASNIGITDSGEHFTATNIEGALSELFTSVSDGKTLVAAAITDKGVTTAATDSFSTMATNIGAIVTGSGGEPLTSAVADSININSVLPLTDAVSISLGAAPLDFIYDTSCIDTSSGTSLANTINTLENTTVLLTWITRSATSTPVGWTLSHTNTLIDSGITQYMSVAYKNTSSGETSVSVTVTQSTSGRIYSSLIALSSQKTVTYISEASDLGSIAFTKPSTYPCLYSMQLVQWTTGSYTCSDTTLDVYIASTSSGRLGNIVDEGAARSLTISAPSSLPFNLVICTLT